VVQLGGLEPPTSCSTDRRSNQLSYNCILLVAPKRGSRTGRKLGATLRFGKAGSRQLQRGSRAGAGHLHTSGACSMSWAKPPRIFSSELGFVQGFRLLRGWPTPDDESVSRL
jgi:hypothetical protein